MAALELGYLFISNSIILTGFDLLLGMLRLTVVPDFFHHIEFQPTHEADPVVVVLQVKVAVRLIVKLGATDFAVVVFVLQMHLLEVIHELVSVANFSVAKVTRHGRSVTEHVPVQVALRLE